MCSQEYLTKDADAAPPKIRRFFVPSAELHTQLASICLCRRPENVDERKPEGLRELSELIRDRRHDRVHVPILRDRPRAEEACSKSVVGVEFCAKM